MDPAGDAESHCQCLRCCGIRTCGAFFAALLKYQFKRHFIVNFRY